MEIQKIKVWKLNLTLQRQIKFNLDVRNYAALVTRYLQDYRFFNFASG